MGEIRLVPPEDLIASGKRALGKVETANVMVDAECVMNRIFMIIVTVLPVTLGLVALCDSK